MEEKNEYMELSEGENAETAYLQGLTSLDDSLDQSIDSLQGSLTLPTFTMGQSSELAGSHGFQVNRGVNLTLSGRISDLSSQQTIPEKISHINSSEPGEFVLNPSSVMSATSHVTSATGHVTSATGHVTSATGHVTTGIKLQGNTLIFPGGQFGAFNMIQTANQYQIVVPSDTKEVNRVQQLVETVTKHEVADSSVINEVFEGVNSDEKSGRSKTSPKHRGKKSRSTSSIGNETSVKLEAMPGPSPCRMDTAETQPSGSDVGFKPSLLDEILTEKKMALMRSPEVIQFLQAQQQQQARDKNVMNKQSSNS